MMPEDGISPASRQSPVNPGPTDREPHPIKERLRIARACDACKRRKIRCTGTLPCRRCTAETRPCEYKAPYSRGQRRKNVSQAVVSSNSSPVISRLTEQNVQPDFIPETEEGVTEAATTPCNGDSPRPYVGPSSSLSFLRHLQRRLRKQTNADEAPSTSILSLGDAALPLFDELSFTLPPRHDAEQMLKTYFELTSPTYKFVHRPTVENWMRQLYDHGRILEDHAHSKYAVVLMVFARATRYTGAASNQPCAETGVEYFQAAEKQLTHESESATLSSVQAFLGCSYYILTRHRFNHCWTLFGTTARLIIALGLHRKKKGLLGCYSKDLIELEYGKRVFWCAYNVDKYLSAMFGRPCAFNDFDINQDMPSPIEDEDLTLERMPLASKDTMNTTVAGLQHQMLGRILGKILRRLYGLEGLRYNTLLQRVAELGADIEAWRQQLPPFLNQKQIESRLLVQPYRNQSNLLSLAVGHAEILVYRPCLSQNLPYSLTEENPETSKQYVAACVRAAISVIETVDQMITAGDFHAASWFANYAAFCAIVIIYTFTIQNRREAPSTWLDEFRAAERCKSRIATVAASIDPLSQRYAIIMDEFQNEVIRQIMRDSPAPQVLSGLYQVTEKGQLEEQEDTPSYDPDANAISWTEEADQELVEFFDMPDWEQFGSLVLDLGEVLPDFGLPA